MNEERRSCTRVPLKIIAHCSTQQDQYEMPHYFIAFSTDLSPQGVCLTLPREVNCGDIVMISLDISSSPFDQPMLCGQVVWVRSIFVWKDTVRHITRAGITFVRQQVAREREINSFMSERTRLRERSLALSA
ncbi:MAG: PilZ domain-containing protein [Candidatus Omnitrophica bacterium]|nr:PilZ domain-containing protein [Candidatus Omnitrophota bacterium]